MVRRSSAIVRSGVPAERPALHLLGLLGGQRLIELGEGVAVLCLLSVPSRTSTPAGWALPSAWAAGWPSASASSALPASTGTGVGRGGEGGVQRRARRSAPASPCGPSWPPVGPLRAVEEQPQLGLHLLDVGGRRREGTLQLRDVVGQVGAVGRRSRLGRVSVVHSDPSKYRSWPSTSGSSNHPEPSSITSSDSVPHGTPGDGLLPREIDAQDAPSRRAAVERVRPPPRRGRSGAANILNPLHQKAGPEGWGPRSSRKRGTTAVGLELKAGTRLRSATDTTEVVVVKAPGEPVDLRCGGHPFVAIDAEVTPEGIEAGFDGGTQLGKRYADEELGSSSCAPRRARARSRSARPSSRSRAPSHCPPRTEPDGSVSDQTQTQTQH